MTHIDRAQITELCTREVLGTASRLFGTRQDALKLFPDYEGAANLVYEYESDGQPLILRVSFTPERSL